MPASSCETGDQCSVRVSESNCQKPNSARARDTVLPIPCSQYAIIKCHVANALACLTFPAPPWDCPQRPDIAPPGVDTSQVRVSRKSVGKTQGILEPGRGLVMGPGVAVGELRLVLASACAEYTSRSRDPRKVCIFIHRLSTRPFGSLP